MAPALSAELWSAVLAHLAPDYTDFDQLPTYNADKSAEIRVQAIQKAQSDLLNCMKVCQNLCNLAGRELYRRPYVTFLGEFLHGSTDHATFPSIPNKRTLLGHVRVLHVDDPLDPSGYADGIMGRLFNDRFDECRSLTVAQQHLWNRAVRSHELASDLLRDAARNVDGGGLFSRLAGVVVGSTCYRPWLARILNDSKLFQSGVSHPLWKQQALAQPSPRLAIDLPSELFLATRGFWCDFSTEGCSLSLSRLGSLPRAQICASLGTHHHSAVTFHRVNPQTPDMMGSAAFQLAPLIPNLASRWVFDNDGHLDDSVDNDIGDDAIKILQFDSGYKQDPRITELAGAPWDATKREVGLAVLSGKVPIVEIYGWPPTPSPVAWQYYGDWQRAGDDSDLAVAHHVYGPYEGYHTFDAFLARLFGESDVAKKILGSVDLNQDPVPDDEYYEAIGPIMDAQAARISAQIMELADAREGTAALVLAPLERRPKCDCGF